MPRSCIYLDVYNLVTFSGTLKRLELVEALRGNKVMRLGSKLGFDNEGHCILN